MAECADTLFVTLLPDGLEVAYEEFDPPCREGKVDDQGNS